MTIFVNVTLVGVVESMTSEVSYALKFQTNKKIRNWKASKKLMYGNLLAISLGNDFNQIIWAYVSERDEDRLQKDSIIIVTLYEHDCLEHGQMVFELAKYSGRMIMAECPIYYR